MSLACTIAPASSSAFKEPRTSCLPRQAINAGKIYGDVCGRWDWKVDERSRPGGIEIRVLWELLVNETQSYDALLKLVTTCGGWISSFLRQMNDGCWSLEYVKASIYEIDDQYIFSYEGNNPTFSGFEYLNTSIHSGISHNVPSARYCESIVHTGVVAKRVDEASRFFLGLARSMKIHTWTAGARSFCRQQTFLDEPEVRIEGKVGVRLEDFFCIAQNDSAVYLTSGVGEFAGRSLSICLYHLLELPTLDKVSESPKPEKSDEPTSAAPIYGTRLTLTSASTGQWLIYQSVRSQCPLPLCLIVWFKHAQITNVTARNMTRYHRNLSRSRQISVELQESDPKRMVQLPSFLYYVRNLYSVLLLGDQVDLDWIKESSPSLTIWAMHSMPAGTHVFFWDTRGQIVCGVVKSTSVGADGTLMVVIKTDGGQTITLPAAAVTASPN
ncbi:hypothetical protein IW262DRAFT_1531994 [Armillaria fumosa]|nr:hypothetical protein IW262DRAFT_1531994 [Armillaria fumosa]